MEAQAQQGFGDASRELARQLMEATLPAEITSVIGRGLRPAGIHGVLVTAGDLGRWEWGRPRGEMVFSALLERAGASLGELHLFGRREPECREQVAEVADFLIPAARNALALAEYRQRARTDALTGLHNREGLDRRLEEEVARARRYELELSLVMIDVDGLKELNDNQGHLAGDRVLVALSQFLEHFVRRSDVVARFGGDEFTLVLPGTNGRSADRVLERLRAEIESQVEIPGISAGRATLRPGESAEVLLARADEEMYRWKRRPARSPQASPVASSGH